MEEVAALEDPIFEDVLSEETVEELTELAFHLLEDHGAEEPEELWCEVRELFFLQAEHCVDAEVLQLPFVRDRLHWELDEILSNALECVFPDHEEDEQVTEGEPPATEEINESQPEQPAEEEGEEKSAMVVQQSPEYVAKQLDYLRSIPQPEQRTKEWYEFRHNLITASNAYKAFESQSQINALIYEKCQPVKNFAGGGGNAEEAAPAAAVNVNSSLHWGQKFEPLSVLLYEHLYQTKVEDFGCIRHPQYSFVGASPDGINVDPGNTERYGRMLEIKNVVSREINGIPKKEYWVQMQLQMEVCGFDTCDFLETKFAEYDSYGEFLADAPAEAPGSLCLTARGKTKGQMIHFTTPDGRPYYCYKPLHITGPEESAQWELDMIAQHEEQQGYSFTRFLYWRLEVWSCILVQRDRAWFAQRIGQLEKVWNMVLHDREHGHEHRAPQRRNNTTATTTTLGKRSNSGPSSGGISDSVCFLKVIKRD